MNDGAATSTIATQLEITSARGARAKNAMMSAGLVHVSATPPWPGTTHGYAAPKAGCCTKNDHSCIGMFPNENGDPLGVPIESS